MYPTTEPESRVATVFGFLQRSNQTGSKAQADGWWDVAPRDSGDGIARTKRPSN